MRAIGLLTIILIAVGCAGSVPPTTSDDDDEPAPKIKEPPTPKDGSSTAPECNGVTEAGTCKDGIAETCNIDQSGTGELRRKDCRALGKSCVQDQQRGAVCEVVGAPNPNPNDACAGLTFEGKCESNVATWCSENKIHKWDCGMDTAGGALKCEMLEDFGAFCVSAGPPPPPPPPSSNCPAFGFVGKCTGPDTTGDGVGDTVIWCSGTDNKTENSVVCGTGNYVGRQCEERPGNSWCYTPPEAPIDECTAIGFKGVCDEGPDGIPGNTDDKPRWCSGGQIQTVTCVAGKVCKDEGDPGACGDGAYCCTP